MPTSQAVLKFWTSNADPFPTIKWKFGTPIKLDSSALDKSACPRLADPTTLQSKCGFGLDEIDAR